MAYRGKEKEEKIEIVIKCLGFRMTIKDACAVAKISTETWRGWIEAEEEIGVRAREAKSKATKTLLQVIYEAAKKGDYKAAILYLEKTDPKQYGPRAALELSGEIDTTSLTGKLTRKEVEQSIVRLADRKGRKKKAKYAPNGKGK